jgi:hypothetical protein
LTEKDVTPIVVAAAGVGVALVTAFAGPIVVEWLAEKRGGPALPGLTAAQLEAWRGVLRIAVLERRVRGAGSQLDQMVRHGVVIDLRADERLKTKDGDLDRAPLRSKDRRLSWSRVTEEWDQSPGRVMILGEPGYGKTVAALTLLKHINGNEASSKPLAEMFPLVEWYHWHAEHPDGRLNDWLADQLSITYRLLPRTVAAALIDADFVLPVLDGMDEVPDAQRLQCKEAIDAYAGRSPPFRPFILTCRVKEYAELAPDWVDVDHQVVLRGLEADQITSVLQEQTAGRPGWTAVRDRVGTGDPDLLELFRSPMRLAIAMQAYRDRDAGELEKLEPEFAEGHLWEQLLTLGSPAFRGADHERIRCWLHFLAAGMHREGHQRFWLHELYLFTTDRQREFRAFGIQFGLGVGLALGLPAAVAVELLSGSATAFLVALAALLTAVFGTVLSLKIRGRDLSLSLDQPDGKRPGLVSPSREPLVWVSAVLLWLPFDLAAALESVPTFGLAFGLFVGVAFGLTNGLITALLAGEAIEHLSVTIGAPRRTRISAIRKDTRRILAGMLATGLLMGLLIGIRKGLAFGLAFGLGVMPTFGLFVGLTLFIRAGTTSVPSDPPHRLAGRGPSAVLTAARNIALAGGLIGGILAGMITGLEAGLVLGRLAGLVFGVTFGVAAGFGLALTFGLTPWVYHYWLRHRLARQGLLPRRLQDFLDWCGFQSRGWLRVSDAYEFRHRELLEHLANSTWLERL